MPPFQQVSSSNFCPASAVIVMWKRLGATTAQLRSGRPDKLTEWDCRVLKRVVLKNRLSSVATLTTAYNDILDNSVIPTLWQQFGEGPFLFQLDNAHVHKASLYRNGLLRFVWKNLTGLHRALTSTLSNTFGMNWNTDCKPGLISQHQCRPH
jgi:hypothetical protein